MKLAGRRRAQGGRASLAPRGAERPGASDASLRAIASGDVQAINYFVALKYVEALKEIGNAPNQKLVLMPLEAAGVIGAIGGIAELAKGALQKQAQPSTPRQA